MRSGLVAVLAVFICGCGGSSPSLVGKWEATSGIFPTEAEYRADGTYSVSMNLSANGPKVLEKGTFKQDGNAVTWQASEIKLDRPGTEKQNLLLKEMPRSGSATLTWDDKGLVTFVYPEGTSAIFRRR